MADDTTPETPTNTPTPEGAAVATADGGEAPVKLVQTVEIEVRPEFELPDYKGLKLRRPVHTFTDAERAREKKRLLEPHGQLAPKEPPVAALDDYVTADVEIKFGDKVINKLDEVRFKIE